LRLRVRLFAVLRERAGRAELALDGLPAQLDVAGLKRELARRHPELGPLESVRCAVGTEYAPDEVALADGAVVALIPPVSGGAPDALEAGVFELRSEPLDPEACRRRVAHDACGACCVFTGCVRDTNRGRRVLRLDYEAYPELAAAEMERIFARCLAQHGAPLRMLVQHRTGALAVGEPSVVVAVASPHRDHAFQACRFLIDELKQSLPVWKKEHYPGGEHWIGDRS
jgi:molybdopterin synthase catalytic subunit